MKVVSIVGTRRPTAYGREVTIRFARKLANRGVIVVSGLALGVDALAHTACLDAGGTTIAILPTSFDMFHPKTNIRLAERIIEQDGAVITEYETGVGGMHYRFLERNRLISGIADAVIVTEANSRSGTLSTVSHALEQGKEVFAVPGNITSPLSAGCNNLIRQGATPLLDIIQVFDSLGIPAHQATTQLGDTPEESAIISLIKQGIRDGDILQVNSGLETSHFSRTLTMMEIKGVIMPLGGNQWSLRS